MGLDLRMGKLRRSRRFGRWLVRADAVGLPFGDASFDAVVASQLVERVPPAGTPSARWSGCCARVAGSIVATPDYGRRRWRFLGALYNRIVPGAGDQPPLARYSRRRLIEEVESRGLSLDAERDILGAEMILVLQEAGGRVENLSARPRNRPLERTNATIET